MKTTMTAIALVLAMTSGAPADTSQGDGAPVPLADGSGRETFSRTYVPVPVRRVAPAKVDPWNHAYAPFASAGAFPTGTAGVYPVPGAATAKELDAQRRAHTVYRFRAYGDIVRAGGCNADFLPVEYAEFCFGGTYGLGSQGGSE